MANKTTTTIDERPIVIPGQYCRALSLNMGDYVILTLEQGTIRILPKNEALRCAQYIITHYTKNKYLATEFIQERRQEAENE